MKLLIKILFFIFGILQINVGEAKVVFVDVSCHKIGLQKTWVMSYLKSLFISIAFVFSFWSAIGYFATGAAAGIVAPANPALAMQLTAWVTLSRASLAERNSCVFLKMLQG